MIIPLFLSAALASSAGVSAGSPPSAEVSTAALAAANLRFSARCAQKSFDVDQVISDATLREDLRSSPVEEARVLVDYAACRAVQGAPQPCTALMKVGSRVGEQAARCLSLAAEDRFIFLTLRGGDALAACRSLVEASGQPGLSIGEGCAAGIAGVRAGDVRAACPALARANFIGPQQTCEDTAIFWSGSAAGCERLSRAADPESKRDCVRRAALVAGSREPARCARSPACLALVSNSPEPCEALAAGFSRMLCGRVDSELSVERKRAAQEEARRAAEKREAGLRVERLARERAAKAAAAAASTTSTTVDAAAVAVAAARAKVEAEEERVKKKAREEARAQAAAEAVVRAKAAAEAKKAAEADRVRTLKPAPQFGKNQPMHLLPIEAVKVMKAIEDGRPIPEGKPGKRKAGSKPKKTRAEETSSEGN